MRIWLPPDARLCVLASGVKVDRETTLLHLDRKDGLHQVRTPLSNSVVRMTMGSRGSAEANPRAHRGRVAAHRPCSSFDARATYCPVRLLQQLEPTSCHDQRQPVGMPLHRRGCPRSGIRYCGGSNTKLIGAASRSDCSSRPHSPQRRDRPALLGSGFARCRRRAACGVGTESTPNCAPLSVFRNTCTAFHGRDTQCSTHPNEVRAHRGNSEHPRGIGVHVPCCHSHFARSKKLPPVRVGARIRFE